eukprot:g2580.t1
MKLRCLSCVLLFALALCVSGVLYVPSSCSAQCTNPENFISRLPRNEGPAAFGYNRAYAWAIVALIQIKESFRVLSPPGAARITAIVGTCLYEAAALTEQSYTSSVGTTNKFGGEVTEEIRSAALDGAGYWALRRLFSDRPSFGRVLSQYQNFAGTSLSPLIPTIEAAVNLPPLTLALETESEVDTTSALRAGAAACERVLEYYTADGFSPRGDINGGPDPTSYQPRNAPQVRAGITDCDAELRNPSAWQPLCVPTSNDGFGTTQCNVQTFLFPWAGRYTTFALRQGSEDTGNTLAGPPPRSGSARFAAQAEEVLSFSANLGDREKIISEYWEDGPDTVTPPGHHWKIAADAAIGEGLTQTDTARLLFVVGNAVYDAGIASWRTKFTFDSSRPLQMIQCGESRGQIRQAWLGLYNGVGEKNISEWRPYQSPTSLSPPFAGYTSGHSTFSAAATQAMRLFFGSDNYRGPSCDRVREGQSRFEPRSGVLPGVSDVPNTGPGTPGYSPAEDVVLCWNTFTDTSDQSGLSRLFGGIHIRADDDVGQTLGRSVGLEAFIRASGLY